MAECLCSSINANADGVSVSFFSPKSPQIPPLPPLAQGARGDSYGRPSTRGAIGKIALVFTGQSCSLRSPFRKATCVTTLKENIERKRSHGCVRARSYVKQGARGPLPSNPFHSCPIHPPIECSDGLQSNPGVRGLPEARISWPASSCPMIRRKSGTRQGEPVHHPEFPFRKIKAELVKGLEFPFRGMGRGKVKGKT